MISFAVLTGVTLNLLTNPTMPPSADIGAPATMRLPLLSLYLTDRCNSRCVSCDYWRTGQLTLEASEVQNLLPELAALGVRVVLLSGGEPLLNPRWAQIAAMLRGNGHRVWLLTSGLSLNKHAHRATALFESITVSLDGTDAATYERIRGLDAFETVCRGIGAAAALGGAVTLRVTLQQENFRQLPRFVSLARELGAARISFLTVDVGSLHAFGRASPITQPLALSVAQVAEFATIVETLIAAEPQAFSCGFIAEAPDKLRRMVQYFAALNGSAQFPPVHCNAPDFSAVLGADGGVSPCFFIRGPKPQSGERLAAALNAPVMQALREQIRRGERDECQRCVCSMWRNPTRAFAHE